MSTAITTTGTFIFIEGTIVTVIGETIVEQNGDLVVIENEDGLFGYNDGEWVAEGEIEVAEMVADHFEIESVWA